MKKETWYCWREYGDVEEESDPRFLIPWADPQKYEFSFDFIFKTEEEAKIALDELGGDPEWILCKMTIEEV